MSPDFRRTASASGILPKPGRANGFGFFGFAKQSGHSLSHPEAPSFVLGDFFLLYSGDWMSEGFWGLKTMTTATSRICQKTLIFLRAKEI